MRAAIVSTYPPRVCGIGAFAAELHGALLSLDEVERVEKVVIVNEPSRPQRTGLVAAVNQSASGDYVRAARTLSRLDVDVVLLEHEYGIYGGHDGEYVLLLAEDLTQPLVVTLHTVLSQPSPHQAAVLTALCSEAELVIVMTETAKCFLVDGGGCEEEKIRVIPHGAPAVLAHRARDYAQLEKIPQRDRYPGRFLLSTFGLISEGKGLETAIAALPAIVERHPNVLYLIAGQTHPNVSKREGERYRLSLERLVADLGLENQVEFDDRFLAVEQIADLLAETDVFLTPYRSLEQISSGVMTFALAAGCAIVSTPYWYAQDLLAEGAGTLVPFADPAAISAAILHYLDEPAALEATRAAARLRGSQLTWPSVAAETAVVLAEAVAREPRQRTAPGPQPVNVRTDHLLTLIDDVGIIQHASGAIPNRDSGYCVDDVARLLGVAFELSLCDSESVWTPVVYRSLAFLSSATDSRLGMHNFMSYGRNWLDEPHHGDHVGRTITALGEMLSVAWVPAMVKPTRRLLDDLVSSFSIETSMRSWAQAVIGLTHLDADRLEENSRWLLENLVERLSSAYEENSTADWPWFEGELSYDNARLPQALIAGGVALARDDLVEAGLGSLHWLGDQCGLGEGMLRLVGHRGLGRGRRIEDSGDEQPLDASALIEAELAAFTLTGEPEHRQRAQLAFAWFLGRNRLELPVYDFATGGCCDGLGEDEISDNEGAESTLAFHRAALLLDSALPSALKKRAL